MRFKRVSLIILIIILISSGVVFSFAADKQASSKVTAYYFHGNFRCPTCYKLETYSREAIETNFKDELNSGKLVFNVINTDENENSHFINDYRLYTKSLILSLVKDGKQVRWVNLDKIWEYAGNKQKFIEYVKSGVVDFLGEAK
ncbi:MAG: nitrophenyl compound nitroreductase subunit ArsF family protein [Candidatus Omnitrophota bacterium]|jgi:hypothetical protein